MKDQLSKMNAPGKLKKYFKEEFLTEIFAMTMFAVAIKVFAAPNHIVAGGVSGVATIVNYLSGFPIGVFSFLMNLPLFFIGWKRIGARFILRTLRIVAIGTVMLDFVIAPFVPDYQGEPLLAALFGGVLVGASLAMVFMRGGSTGGSDILIKIIKQKKAHLSFGKLALITDMTVLLAAALAYQSIEAVAYGVVMIFVSSETLDRMVAGTEQRRLVFVMSQRRDILSQHIIEQLERGVTLIDATGGYSGQPVGMLMCVVDNRQLFALKEVIKTFDPQAFVIVAQASEILGLGFKSIFHE